MMYRYKDGANGVARGFAHNGREYVEDTGDLLTVFHFGHERAENTIAYQNAIRKALDEAGNGGKLAFEAYLRLRGLSDVTGETRNRFYKEFLCELAGACTMQVATGQDVFNQLGVSEALADDVFDAFSNALLENVEQSDDESEFSTNTIKPGHETQLTTDDVDTNNADAETVVRSRSLNDINDELFEKIDYALYPMAIRRVREMLNANFSRHVYVYRNGLSADIVFSDDGNITVIPENDSVIWEGNDRNADNHTYKRREQAPTRTTQGDRGFTSYGYERNYGGFGSIRDDSGSGKLDREKQTMEAQSGIGGSRHASRKKLVNKSKAPQGAFFDEIDGDDGGELSTNTIKAPEKINSIKNQIREHASELRGMQSVKTVDVAQTNGLSKREVLDLALKRFGKAATIDRREYGTIVFGKNQIDSGLKHIDIKKNRETIAALFAVPNVIKQGLVIGRENNHNGVGQRTVTFGAPIAVKDGEKVETKYMGVVVIEDRKNFYHAHQLLLLDKDASETNKVDAGLAVASRKGDVVAPTESTFDLLISDSAEKSKMFSISNSEENSVLSTNTLKMPPNHKAVTEAYSLFKKGVTPEEYNKRKDMNLIAASDTTRYINEKSFFGIKLLSRSPFGALSSFSARFFLRMMKPAPFCAILLKRSDVISVSFALNRL